VVHHIHLVDRCALLDLDTRHWPDRHEGCRCPARRDSLGARGIDDGMGHLDVVRESGSRRGNGDDDEVGSGIGSGKECGDVGSQELGGTRGGVRGGGARRSGEG